MSGKWPKYRRGRWDLHFNSIPVMLSDKNKAAVSLGRLGGLARSAALSPERRKEIARNAANKRWNKVKRRKMGAD